MGWTKKQFIEQAFDEIGLASYVFDMSASDLQNALRKLDSMVATWNGNGMMLSYPLPSSPSTSDINIELNIPDYANEAIYTNLAARLASSFGKTASIETMRSAKASYQVLLNRSYVPREMQFPSTMPAGAGNKTWRISGDPFLNKPVERLDKNLEWLTTN